MVVLSRVAWKRFSVRDVLNNSVQSSRVRLVWRGEGAVQTNMVLSNCRSDFVDIFRAGEYVPFSLLNGDRDELAT